jgi:hypothetical protein
MIADIAAPTLRPSRPGDDERQAIRGQIEEAYLFTPHFKNKMEVERWCSQYYPGQVFISHAAADNDWCMEHLVNPIRNTFWLDTYFLLIGSHLQIS